MSVIITLNSTELTGIVEHNVTLLSTRKQKRRDVGESPTARQNINTICPCRLYSTHVGCSACPSQRCGLSLLYSLENKMKQNKLTKADVKKHIKKRLRLMQQGKTETFDFLGFVENHELTNEVEQLFTFCSPSGYTGYDWVNGNNRLHNLIERIQ